MKQSLMETDGDTDSKQRLRLWLKLLKTSRTIETQLRDNLRLEFASTLPRFDVLAALSRFDDGLKMSQLSEVLRVSNGNVTGIVDRLVDDGLLVRVAVHGDRRAPLVRMTKRGQSEFAKQAAAHEAWVDSLLGAFDATEAAELSARFEELINSFTETKK